MEAIKLKNGELQKLSQEIQLFSQELVKEETNEKGEKVQVNPGFLPKFHLNNLLSILNPIFKNLEDTRIEMVIKYGKEDSEHGGAISVPEFVEGSETENTQEFKDFKKDYEELLDTEVEVSFAPFPLSVAQNLKTDRFYPTLYKFIK